MIDSVADTTDRFAISAKWLVCYFVACAVVATLDIVVQIGANYWLTGRSVLGALDLWPLALGEWTTRSLSCPVAAAVISMPQMASLDRAKRMVIHLALSVSLVPIALLLSFPFVLPSYRGRIQGLNAFAEVSSRYIISTVVAYWLTIGILYALEQQKRYRNQVIAAGELERRTQQLEASLTTTRLEALKSKVRPHFIFNTLNAILVLTRGRRMGAVEKITARLGKLITASVDEASSVDTLAAEVQLVRDYLYIEKVRFGRRLRVRWLIDPAATHVAVPRFSLQPLVENSIKHAVAATTAPVTIEVGARLDDRTMILWVEDSKPNAEPAAIREGFGLSSLRSRLYFLYGSRQQMTIAANPSGTRVELRIHS